MVAAPKGDCAGHVGIGLHHRLCRNNAYHPRPRHDRQLLIDCCRQCAPCCRLWDPVVWRAEVRRAVDFNSTSTRGCLALASRLLDGPLLCTAGCTSNGYGGDRHCLYLTGSLSTLAPTWRERVAVAHYGATPCPCHDNTNPHSACRCVDPSPILLTSIS